MRRLLAITAAAALTLSACGGDTATEPTTTAASPPATQEAETPAAEEASEEETTEETEDEAPKATAEDWGVKMTWEDGTSITVSEPEPYEPGEYFFASEEWDKYVVSEVVLENGTEEAIESFLLNFQATTGDVEAESIFDSPTIEMPTAKVQPGKSLKFNIGFGVQPGEDFDLTISNMNDFMNEDFTLSTTL